MQAHGDYNIAVSRGYGTTAGEDSGQLCDRGRRVLARTSSRRLRNAIQPDVQTLCGAPRRNLAVICRLRGRSTRSPTVGSWLEEDRAGTAWSSVAFSAINWSL